MGYFNRLRRFRLKSVRMGPGCKTDRTLGQKHGVVPAFNKTDSLLSLQAEKRLGVAIADAPDHISKQIKVAGQFTVLHFSSD